LATCFCRRLVCMPGRGEMVFMNSGRGTQQARRGRK
jgi:hypothetical protein